MTKTARGKFIQEAQLAFTREMSDVRKACRIFEHSKEGEEEDAYERAQQYCNEPLEVVPMRLYRITLTTGGPACGYDIVFDSDDEACMGSYWYQDWYQPKKHFPLTKEQLAAVVNAYSFDSYHESCVRQA